MSELLRPVDHPHAALSAQFAAAAEARGVAVGEVKREHYSALGGRSGTGRRIDAIERRVRALVAEAPDLTPAQVERLQAIFRSVGGGAA